MTWSTADDALTLILSANLVTPTTFSLYLWRSNWLFPPGSTQSVTLTFDGKAQVLSGNGINHTITVNLDATTFRPFLHGFTGGQSLSIAAPGDATPGLIGLEGTTAAVTELGQCTVADGFTQLPAPFAPATPATEAAAKASIQAASSSTATQSASPPDPFGDVRAKPLAQADYAGKALSISYGGLQATLEPDTSIDPQVCNDSKTPILLYEVSANNTSKACQIIKEIVDVNSKQVIVAPVATFDSSTTYDALDLSLAIRHLDSSSSLPQVIVSGNTGGAHCCVISAATTETSDTKWQIVQLGAVDGNGFDFLNLTQGGDDLLVTSNDDFLYKFSSYAGSNAPTRILQLRGVHLQDVTANPAYRNFLLRELKSMETFEAQSSDSEPNGYLAGWVAQKALVGQFYDAWRVMLSSYDHQATDGLTDCAIDKRDWVKSSLDSSYMVCPDGEEITIAFPEALALFLVDEGYITPQQSTKEGYNPAAIKAERATALETATAQYEQNQAQQEQASDGWWEYSTNDSKCEIAESTPKDAYDTLKATGSGPWVQRLSHDHVQLDWPDATNPQLYNYIDFFRNEAACLTFASALDNANNDLK